MNYAVALKGNLDRRLPGKVVYMPKWSTASRKIDWRARGKKPNALLLHHTAGAATDSTDPKHKGNQKGANAGIINFVQSHYPVPAANFTLDRDGTVYVHSAYPVWHAGLGDFKGQEPWNRLGIFKDAGNDYMLGVEIVSKGVKKDYTAAQQESLVALMAAVGAASGWDGYNLLRHPRHKDWAPRRKVDIVYTQPEVDEMVAKYHKYWDGVVPLLENVKVAQDTGIKNDAAWRVACRLKDLGHYEGEPLPNGQQGYPRKAISAFQKSVAGESTGNYGPKTHAALFG